MIGCWRWIAEKVGRSRFLWVILLTTVFLTGCVDYDIGIRFDHASRGEIVQHIHLGERLIRLNDGTVQQWVKAIEQPTASLGGQIQRSQDGEFTIRIPFNSSADLEKKFNQFSQIILNLEPLDRPQLKSHLTIDHRNFLLVEHNRLWYEGDLRSLGVLSSQGDVILSPTSLIRLEFNLETPWGAQVATGPETLAPTLLDQGRVLHWILTPDSQNSLETSFWLPHPLGLGTLLILILVTVGKGLKDFQSRPVADPPTTEGSAGSRE